MRPGQEEEFNLQEYAAQGFQPRTPTGAQMPGGSAAGWANFVQEQYGMSAAELIGASEEERYAGYAQQHDIALTPEEVPVGADGLPSRPPKTPQEAALFQFVSEQRTRQRNEELLQQSIQQLQEGVQVQRTEQERARGETRETLEAGAVRQEQEVAEVRAENRQLMEQSLGIMQYALGLVRRGGEGSLAHFQQPGYGQMAQTLMAGRETPYDFTQPFRDIAAVEAQVADYGRFYVAAADVYNQSQFFAQDFSFYLTPYAYGVGIGGA
jgi:hypothetical protein